jgi:hypothetical protein
VGRGLLRGANSAFVAHGQLMTALRATTCQHSSAIRRFHTHSKPMCLCPMTIIGLKRTLWHYRSSYASCGLSAALDRLTGNEEREDVLNPNIQYTLLLPGRTIAREKSGARMRIRSASGLRAKVGHPEQRLGNGSEGQLRPRLGQCA